MPEKIYLREIDGQTGEQIYGYRMSDDSKAQQNRARVNRFRDRQRELGRVQRTVWAHPEDWPRIRKYIERLNKEREN